MRYVLATYLSEMNRFYFHWQRSDAWGAILAVVLVGIGLYAGFLGLRLLGRPGRIAGRLAFVLFSLFFVKVAVCETAGLADWMSNVLKGVVVSVSLVALFKRKAIVRLLETVCLIFSPIFPVVAGQLLIAQTYDSTFDEDTTVEQPIMIGENPKGSIFLFLFDGWSYTRSVADGHALPDFPSIVRASETAVVFHNAYSPGLFTASSIPSMLCGAVGRAELRGGRHYLDHGGHALPTRERNNMFSVMKAKGYRTCLYALYLPWAELLIRGLDRCESRSYYRIFGLGTWQTCGAILFENLDMRVNRFFPPLEPYKQCVQNRHAVQLQEWTHAQALREVQNASATFAFFHYPVPHAPYVFRRTGPKSNLKKKYRGSVGNYMDNLRFADTLMGGLLDELEARPDYQRTMYIFTSDHTFRQDPRLRQQETEELCRVPLLIHLPGQSERVNIDVPFSTAWLLEILDAHVGGGQNVDSFVERCSGFRERRLEFAWTEEEIDFARKGQREAASYE